LSISVSINLEWEELKNIILSTAEEAIRNQNEYYKIRELRYGMSM